MVKISRKDTQGIYTQGGYVLGIRCEAGHSGNRRFWWDRRSWFAECVGCKTFLGLFELPRFANRQEALRADRQFRAEWPWDPPGDVLAGKRI